MAGQISQKGFNDADVVDFLRRLRNHSHSQGATPNLAPATVTTNIKSLAGIAAIVDGVQVTKAAADPLITLSGASFTATAAGQSNIVLIQMDASGTITLKQGPIIAGGAGDNEKTIPLPLPDLARCVIGYIMIVNAVFTPGTTAVTAGILKDGDPFLLPGVQAPVGATVGLVS